MGTCHKPLKKVCSESGSDKSDKVCQTYHETSCTSKYVEKETAKFVGHSSCSRIPRVLCGDQCRMEEAEEECFEKDIDTVTDTPEESCDLTPFKTCHKVTKLVPTLTPRQECTVAPQEVCLFVPSKTAVVDKSIETIWCMETNEEIAEVEVRKSKAFKSNFEVSHEKAIKQLSQMSPPPRIKTVGIGSAFVFPGLNNARNDIHQRNSNVLSQVTVTSQNQTKLSKEKNLEENEIHESKAHKLSIQEIKRTKPGVSLKPT